MSSLSVFFQSHINCVHQLSHRIWDCGCESISIAKVALVILTFLGLRGRMEAGWSRMNDLIVIQASQVRENALVWQTRTAKQSDNLGPVRLRSRARRQRSRSRSGHRIRP